MYSVGLWLLVFAVAATAREISDELYAQFPRLYHLDDYDACLSKTDGLYCLGTFNINPPAHHDYLYQVLKEYSEDPHHFNRSQLYRGYCVSERCPSAERNTTHRFEQCAARWGRRRRLRLSLKHVSYCKTHAQEYAQKHNPKPLDLPQKAIVAVSAVLLFLNILGTFYDVVCGDNYKQHDMLGVWSIRSNWRRLTATYEDGDPRLTALLPVQGVRVFLMLLIIGTHATIIHTMLYLQNPRYLEMASRLPGLMLFLNGTSVVMIFVMISSFLLAYNLLLLSKRYDLRMDMLKWCILKRVARISPVSILVVGFAATFWPLMGGGPMWPTLVDAESNVCRDKFWYQVFYINNIVRPDDHCLVQTWFLATDMQLYIVASMLTLWLAKKRLLALPILFALIVASCLVNFALAYYFNWKSVLYHTYPEETKRMYRGVESFYRFYISPWGSLPACLVGLFIAHLHFELQERNINITKSRVVRLVHRVTPAVIVWCLLAGQWVRAHSDPLSTALYTALERPVISVMSAFVLLGMINGMKDFLTHYFAWSGWHAMGRMSLSVLMLHWLVNTVIAASRPQPIATSLLYVVVDSVSTAVLTYLLAVPLTLMVEMPVSRFINNIFFERHVDEIQKQKQH